MTRPNRLVNVFISALSTLFLSCLLVGSGDVPPASAQNDPADGHLSQEITIPAPTIGTSDSTRFLFVRSTAGLQRMMDCDWTIAGSFTFVNGPNCINDLPEDRPDSFTAGNLISGGVQDCYFGHPCRVLVPDGMTEIEYSLYQVSQGSEPCFANMGSGQDFDSCLLNAGCLLDGQGGFACPPVAELIGSVLAVKQAAITPTSSTPAPTKTSDTATAENASNSYSKLDTSFFSPSVLGTLPVFGDTVLNAQKAALAAGVALVLAILVMLPTQLINSTLEANSSVFEKLKQKLSPTYFRQENLEIEISNGSTEQAKKLSARIFSLFRALPVFLVASVIVSFADPSFGLNGLTVRFFLTALASFLILNYASTVFVWSVFRKNVNGVLPSVRIKYSYLVVLLLTVLISRLLSLEPVIVFGSVLAFETGRIIKDNLESGKELLIPARMQFISIVTLAGLGTLSWIMYSLIEAQGLQVNHFDVSLSEFFAAVAIEGLATLPVVLLPLKFMPGVRIFKWNRLIWFVSFAVSTALFVAMLLPLRQSWDTISTTLLTWSTVFALYCLFAVVFWAGFKMYSRDSRHK